MPIVAMWFSPSDTMTNAIVLPSADRLRPNASSGRPGTIAVTDPSSSTIARSWRSRPGVSVGAVPCEPWCATPVPTSVEGRVATKRSTIAAAIAATATNAPAFRLRAFLRCRSSCCFHASRSGSVCLVTISKTSISSAIVRASLSEYGSALRRERTDGRRTDAHDPSGLLGAVAVHVEQDEGGALARRQLEQHATDVLPEIHLVERVGRRGDGHQPARGPDRGARPHPEPVERHAEQVPRGI